MTFAGLQPQQEVVALRAAQVELVRERQALLADLAKWDDEIERKKQIVAQLEHTAAQLLEDGAASNDVLPRCAAEVGRSAAPVQPEGANDSKQEASSSFAGGEEEPAETLSHRLAAAVARGAGASIVMGFEAKDFDREFCSQASDRQKQFLEQFSVEQRLLWELQNPIECSLRADRQLLKELAAASKVAECDLLIAAAGVPTLRELQYRPLLWLRHQQNLDAAYVEASMGTSLLAAACGCGFDDLVGELLQRRADVNGLTSEGQSPLTIAAAQGSSHVCAALVDAGADVLVRDKAGCTAADVAIRSGHTELATWLEQRGRA